MLESELLEALEVPIGRLVEHLRAVSPRAQEGFCFRWILFVLQCRADLKLNDDQPASSCILYRLGLSDGTAAPSLLACPHHDVRSRRRQRGNSLETFDRALRQKRARPRRRVRADFDVNCHSRRQARRACNACPVRSLILLPVAPNNTHCALPKTVACEAT